MATMLKTMRFNTGRRYTAAGQRITAVLWDDALVTFMDHDRMIAGEFKLGQHCALNQVEVMHWYDACKYQMSSRAIGKEHAWVE